MMSNSSECLRLVVGTWMPHMIVSGDSKNPIVTGTMLEVIEVFAQRANFCYKFVVPEDMTGGVKLPNGSWTGVIKSLIDKTITFTALGIAINPDRAEAVDFSEHLYVDEWTAGFRRPKLESDILGYVKPFTHWAWLGILLSMFIFIASLIVVQRGYNFFLKEKSTDLLPVGSNGEANERIQSNDSAMHDAGMWTLATLLSQPSTQTPSGGCLRVLSTVWLMMSFILVTVYRSNLKAMLILPKVVLPFDNLEQLAETNLRVWTPVGSLLHSAVETSPNGSIFRRLKKQMIGLDGPMNVSWGVWGMTHGEFVFTGPMSAFAQITHSAFSKTGRCDTYAISEGFLRTTLACILLQKGSPWKAKLDPIIVRLRESGILDYIYKKGVYNATECFKPVSSLGTPNLRPMDLVDFYGVFMVYAGGIFAAAVSFAIEVVTGRRTTPEFQSFSLAGFRRAMGNEGP